MKKFGIKLEVLNLQAEINMTDSGIWDNAKRYYKGSITILNPNNHEAFTTSCFWGSMARPAENSDCISMFYNVLSDALAYVQSKDVEVFMREFGYTSWKEGRKAYKGCKKSYQAMQRLFGLDEDSLCDVLNEMQEKYEDFV